MVKQASGFLADDGTFFEREPECKRYEAMQKLTKLCDSHGTNFENFLYYLNEWHATIQEYYNANNDCETPQERTSGVGDEDESEYVTGVSNDTTFDDIPAFLSSEEHQPYLKGRDKDAPGFLEQSFGKHK